MEHHSDSNRPSAYIMFRPIGRLGFTVSIETLAKYSDFFSGLLCIAQPTAIEPIDLPFRDDEARELVMMIADAPEWIPLNPNNVVLMGGKNEWRGEKFSEIERFLDKYQFDAHKEQLRLCQEAEFRSQPWHWLELASRLGSTEMAGRLFDVDDVVHGPMKHDLSWRITEIRYHWRYAILRTILQAGKRRGRKARARQPHWGSQFFLQELEITKANSKQEKGPVSGENFRVVRKKRRIGA